MNLDRLTEIGIKYNTDKSYFHLFTEFYAPYFEKYTDRNINILEIGIYKGASLQMLSEFFPKATIYAIDINDEYVNQFYGNNIKTYKCSQIDVVNFNALFAGIEFDIIIDDGSHITSHQQKSLGFVFPYLKKGGIYVCEDLHTSYDRGYIDTNFTTLAILENYNKTKDFNIDILNEEQNRYLTDNITGVDIYYRSKNALKCYSCNKLNITDLSNCYCGVNLSPNNKSVTCVILTI